MLGHKKNTYTLWVTRAESADGAAVTPIHYEMMGYNTLLGSHYDKYIVEYKEFSPQVDPKVFSLPEGVRLAVALQCMASASVAHSSVFVCACVILLIRDDLWRIPRSRSGAPPRG